MTSEETARNKEKLQQAKDRLAVVLVEIKLLEDQLAPIVAKVEKLRKDAAYYNSRVIKYEGILAQK